MLCSSPCPGTSPASLESVAVWQAAGLDSVGMPTQGVGSLLDGCCLALSLHRGTATQPVFSSPSRAVLLSSLLQEKQQGCPEPFCLHFSGLGDLLL